MLFTLFHNRLNKIAKSFLYSYRTGTGKLRASVDKAVLLSIFEISLKLAQLSDIVILERILQAVRALEYFTLSMVY